MVPKTARLRACTAALLAAAVTACAAPRGAMDGAPRPAYEQGDAAAIARARADSARHPYTVADVHFMTVMIGHHAQAIEMGRLAPGRAASPSIRTLADRIVNAQQDEIARMQQWLRDRLQPVPELDSMGVMRHGGAADHSAHAGHGAAHGAAGAPAMHGMLSEAQMRQLAAARGPEFDQLFLRFMIQHHRGAVGMVEELFATDGAGQDETVFKLASDVNVDQITEISRMERMLLQLLIESRSP